MAVKYNRKAVPTTYVTSSHMLIIKIITNKYTVAIHIRNK